MGSGVLQRVASGEGTAFTDCLSQYGDLIWSLARRYSKSAADAEDAAQEICLRLWRNAHHFDATRGAESAFVATLARRVLIDRHRESTRRPQAVSIDGQDFAATHPNDDELFADGERAATALRQLRPEQQQVITLSIHQGLTQSEIATRTGHPLGTVKSLMRRGFLELRAMLVEGSKR
jgi:RNA polymerase sigma-70 factor, ECF subfamily